MTKRIKAKYKINRRGGAAYTLARVPGNEGAEYRGNRGIVKPVGS